MLKREMIVVGQEIVVCGRVFVVTGVGARFVEAAWIDQPYRTEIFDREDIDSVRPFVRARPPRPALRLVRGEA